MTRSGYIRLGTLRDFRDTARHSGKILDAGEGRKRITETVFEVKEDTPAPLTRRAFGLPAHGAPPPNWVIRNNLITQDHETHNLWMFSTSGTLMSVADVQKLAPGYDACAVIHRPFDAYVLIGRALSKQHPLRNVGGFWTVYRDREQTSDLDDGLDPVLIKPPDYVGWDEFRFIYDPIDLPTENEIFLTVPDLVACCRILQDDEIPK